MYTPQGELARHNQIGDLEAILMSEVCKDVQREPPAPLLPLSGEMFNLRSTNTASEARLDISARGIWNSVDKTFFDVRVFHPGAESNKAISIDAAFERHEQEKRTYNRRVLSSGAARVGVWVMRWTHTFNLRIEILIL